MASQGNKTSILAAVLITSVLTAIATAVVVGVLIYWVQKNKAEEVRVKLQGEINELRQDVKELPNLERQQNQNQNKNF